MSVIMTYQRILSVLHQNSRNTVRVVYDFITVTTLFVDIVILTLKRILHTKTQNPLQNRNCEI